MHDNKGGYADLHLPLGTGTLDFRVALKALQTAGYDGPITLEVFSEDHSYLAYSRDVLKKAWASFQEPNPRPLAALPG
jgi:sugar phosphate isomerase/epimerase